MPSSWLLLAEGNGKTVGVGFEVVGGGLPRALRLMRLLSSRKTNW